MKVKFFYAPPIFNTWSKLFVLSADGTFYSSFLINLELTEHEEKVDFAQFKSNEYLFNAYQPITEITKEEALSARLTKQNNWVQEYLDKKSI